MPKIIKSRLNGSETCENPAFVLKGTVKGVQLFPGKEDLDRDNSTDIDVYSYEFSGFVQLSEQQVVYTEDRTSATSISPSLLAHRKKQVKDFVDRFGLGGKKVVDIGCGDGHLLDILKIFNVEAIGLEPSEKTAKFGIEAGRPVVHGFMTEQTKLKEGPFDAFLSFHVLEHIPDFNGFLRGIYSNLRPNAVGLIEVPSLEQILEGERFFDFFPDHLNYFSLRTLRLACEMNGFDVLETMRDWAGEHNIAIVQKRTPVDLTLLQQSAQSIVRDLTEFTQNFKSQEKRIAVWGASCQALVLLAACKNLPINYIIDTADYKQGRYTPVSHFPIVGPDHLATNPVDVVIVIAPRFELEILAQLRDDCDFHGTIASIHKSTINVISSE